MGQWNWRTRERIFRPLHRISQAVPRLLAFGEDTAQDVDACAHRDDQAGTWADQQRVTDSSHHRLFTMPQGGETMHYELQRPAGTRSAGLHQGRLDGPQGEAPCNLATNITPDAKMLSNISASAANAKDSATDGKAV